MIGPAAALPPATIAALARIAAAVGLRPVTRLPRGVSHAQAWMLRHHGLLATGALVQPSGRAAPHWWLTSAGTARLAREALAA